MELARRDGFKFGAKIVRGAYMEQERARAKVMNYDDPIHVSYQATCENFDSICDMILQEVKHGNANIMVASHNEQSVAYTLQRYVGCLLTLFSYGAVCMYTYRNSSITKMLT